MERKISKKNYFYRPQPGRSKQNVAMVKKDDKYPEGWRNNCD